MSTSGLPSSLKLLYNDMSKTTEAVTPTRFLSDLRRAFPQFAEMARPSGAMKALGAAYAQQGEYHIPIYSMQLTSDTPKMRRNAGFN